MAHPASPNKKNRPRTPTRSPPPVPSTIRSIPNELLELVFYLATRPPSNRPFFLTPTVNHNPFDPLFPRSTARQPPQNANHISRPFIYDIASVSRNWREIALQNSALWSSIHLTRSLSVHRAHKTTLDPHLFSWLSTHLSRCQSSPSLQLVLDCTRLPSLSILLPYLLSTSPRWTSLVLLVSHVGVLPQTLSHLEDVYVPTLKELEIAADVYREGIVCTDVLPGFFKSGAPKLDKVRLNRVYISWLEKPLVRSASTGSPLVGGGSPTQLSVSPPGSTIPIPIPIPKIRPLKQASPGVKLTTLELRFTSWWPDFEDLIKLFGSMPKLRVLIVQDDLSAIIRNVGQPPAPPPHSDRDPPPPYASSCSTSPGSQAQVGGSPPNIPSNQSPRSKTPIPTRDTTTGRRKPPPEPPKIELPSLSVLEIHSFKPPSRPSQLSSNLNPEISPLPRSFLQLFDLPLLEELRVRGITPAQWNDCLVPYFKEQVQERGKFGMLQRLVLGEFVDDDFDSSIKRLFRLTMASGHGLPGLSPPLHQHHRTHNLGTPSLYTNPLSTTPFVLNAENMQAAFPYLTSLRLDHIDPNPFIDLFLGDAYDFDCTEADGWDAPTPTLFPKSGKDTGTHRTVQPIWPFLQELAINLAVPVVVHEPLKLSNGQLGPLHQPVTGSPTNSTSKSRDSLRRRSELLGLDQNSTLNEFITKMEAIENQNHGFGQGSVLVMEEEKRRRTTVLSHDCELVVLATALMSRTLMSRPLKRVWLDKEFMLEGMVDVLKQHRVEVRDVRYHSGLDCGVRLFWAN